MNGSGPHTLEAFRSVPRTGVIYVMTEAERLGFRMHSDDWCNLGQGQPDTGDLPGAPARRTSLEIGLHDQDYAPAYRYGVDAFTRYPGRRWEDVDAELARGWTGARGDSRLDWERARPASQDAWHRLSNTVERVIPGDSERDGR